MIKAFKNLPHVLQIILLLIPGVNWITEAILRWGHVLEKKPTAMRVVIAIICFPLPFGIFFGWVDLVVLLLNDYKTLVLED